MIYTPRSNSIEAAPVELAGQRLMAIALDGKAHLVDAGVFETLFAAEPEPVYTTVTIHPAKAAEIAKDVARGIKRALAGEKPKPKPKATSVPAEGSRAAQCLKILREHGPLTTAELQGHVFADLPRDRWMINFSDLSIRMRRRKLIETREDPATHLDKWHIVEASDGKR